MGDIEYNVALKLTVFGVVFHFTLSITCDWITMSHSYTQRIEITQSLIQNGF